MLCKCVVLSHGKTIGRLTQRYNRWVWMLFCVKRGCLILRSPTCKIPAVSHRVWKGNKDGNGVKIYLVGGNLFSWYTPKVYLQHKTLPLAPSPFFLTPPSNT